MATRHLKFSHEPAENPNSLPALKSGFTVEGQSLEYRLPAARVLGARAFKKTDESLKLSAEPTVRPKARMWTVGKSNMEKDVKNGDLFVVIASSELQRWSGSEQELIEEVLEGMRMGRRKGEVGGPGEAEGGRGERGAGGQGGGTD